MCGLVALIGLLAFATPGSAECPWVLWVETPLGSDQWSVPDTPETRFSEKATCQHRADDLNAFVATMDRGHRVGGGAHDAFTCVPCTVDPRSEAALLYEGASPRGGKPR
jgi:hypothetical protein